MRSIWSWASGRCTARHCRSQQSVPSGATPRTPRGRSRGPQVSGRGIPSGGVASSLTCRLHAPSSRLATRAPRSGNRLCRLVSTLAKAPLRVRGARMSAPGRLRRPPSENDRYRFRGEAFVWQGATREQPRLKGAANARPAGAARGFGGPASARVGFGAQPRLKEGEQRSPGGRLVGKPSAGWRTAHPERRQRRGRGGLSRGA